MILLWINVCRCPWPWSPFISLHLLLLHISLSKHALSVFVCVVMVRTGVAHKWSFIMNSILNTCCTSTVFGFLVWIFKDLLLTAAYTNWLGQNCCQQQQQLLYILLVQVWWQWGWRSTLLLNTNLLTATGRQIVSQRGGVCSRGLLLSTRKAHTDLRRSVCFLPQRHLVMQIYPPPLFD